MQIKAANISQVATIGGRWKMLVENIDHEVEVERFR